MNRISFLLIISCYLFFIATPSLANDTGEDNIEAQKVLTGITLYEEHCAKCHKSFAKTTKPQRSINRLRSSIKHFPAMQYLDFLSDKELEALAAALATKPL